MEYISHVKLGDETVDASIEAADRDSPVEVWIKVCKLDKQGEPVRDAAGRPVWRIRRHDVEEFHDVARRWGLWTSTLEKLAGALAEKAQLPLLNQAKPSKRKARAAAGG